MDVTPLHIHFVVNFHGIQAFLSEFDTSADNIVLIGEEEQATRNFLKRILPENSLQTLRPVRFDYGQRLRDVFANARRLLSQTRAEGTVVPAGRKFTLHIYSLVFPFDYYAHLFREIRNADKILFVQSHKGFYHLEELKTVSWKLKTAAFIYGLIAGGRFQYYVDSVKVPLLGLRNDFPKYEGVRLGWSAIREKFHFRHNEYEKEAVLIVDMPVQAWPEIDLKGSQDELVRFFKRKLDAGKKIHLKPHYYRPGVHSFRGTEIENEIRILSSEFPTEIIFDDYDEVYAFTSAAMYAKTSAKKFSLVKLLRYHDQALAERLMDDALTCSGGPEGGLVFAER